MNISTNSQELFKNPIKNPVKNWLAKNNSGLEEQSRESKKRAIKKVEEKTKEEKKRERRKRNKTKKGDEIRIADIWKRIHRNMLC